MSHSPVLVVVDFLRGNPMLMQCQGMGDVFKYWEHQMIKQIYERTIQAISKSNKTKTKIVMKG